MQTIFLMALLAAAGSAQGRSMPARPSRILSLSWKLLSSSDRA